MAKRIVLTTMVFLGCSLAAAVPDVYAQYDCGAITRSHAGWQVMDRPRYEIQVATERGTVALCPLLVEVQTEAWIHGTGGADVDRNPWVAWVQFSMVVPTDRTAYSTGKHWLIINLGFWTQYPPTSGSAYIWPPPPKNFDLCIEMGGQWVDGTCRMENTPIIVDVENDGYELTSARNGVFFDLDADGEKERVAWTDPNGNEAFLVLDRNGNGRIDDGTELFGDRSPIYRDTPEPRAQNGFDALLALEKPDYGRVSADRIIDRRDAAFDRLFLWHDANHDGISQPGELMPVRDTKIVGVGTTAKEKRRVDKYGNRFGLKGLIYIERPNGKIKSQDVWDIWLKRDS